MSQREGVLVAAIDGIKNHTDGFPWYWLSYGEKCYAFACVEAVPCNEDDPLPTPGTELEPHPENDQTWIGENGTEMMTMDTIAQIERQNGDAICRFIAVAHATLCEPTLENPASQLLTDDEQSTPRCHERPNTVTR